MWNQVLASKKLTDIKNEETPQGWSLVNKCQWEIHINPLQTPVPRQARPHVGLDPPEWSDLSWNTKKHWQRVRSRVSEATLTMYYNLGVLKQQKCILLQFWRLEVQNEGVSRAVLPLEALWRMCVLTWTTVTKYHRLRGAPRSRG